MLTLSNGNVLVTWTEDETDGSDHGVYYIIFTSSMTVYRSKGLVDPAGVTGNQKSTSVWEVSDGFFIAWIDD